MKKTIFIMCAFAATAALADGNYLYWMVDETEAEPGTTTYQFDYAKVKEADTSRYLCLKNGTDELDSNSDRLTTDGQYWEVDGSYTGDYWFELWSDGASDNPLAYAPVSSAYLSANGFIYKNQETSGHTPYVVTASQLVPEPTGGLLTLFGVALLALRRRREVRG